MESRQQDSTEVKTHDEILRLFKDLESIEAKVKNSELFEKDFSRAETFLREIEPQVKKPEEPNEETSQPEPPDEMRPELEEKQKRPFWRKKEKQFEPPGLKTPWFSFLKRKTDNQLEQETPTEVEAPTPEIKIPRSTFILQLDTEGNLTGLPLKKPKPEKQEEEQVKGLRGKLGHIGSFLRRKNASEAESKTGIGDKIKGIFRRKSKE
ncbi:MAG: hypothetical protein JW840_02765 [Candidatus Thermoplasmatota archaeon]|nr:hypothetical protein [Candidatus Thermoplasmatota archaeon]